MTPTELRKLFEQISNPQDGYSKQYFINNLALNFSSDFKTTNGSQWSRANSYLGKKYNIIKTYKSGRLESIQLDGFKETQEYHSIPSKVREFYNGKPCVFTGSYNQIEIDHKDARYTKNYDSIEDFQPVCKAINDIKREICKKCKNNNCRPKGSTLGFPFDFLKGNEKSDYCEGCYYYDPIKFRAGL